jgi:HEPN domain-containing protein
MSERIENIDQVIQYWMESAEKDHRTMHTLLNAGDYSWAMFIGHLVLEKLLKAHYVKNLGKHALFTHDLLRLAILAGLKPEGETADLLDEISSFNINARYDNYKQDFYKRCTYDFAQKWADRIDQLRTWLIKEL